MPSTRKTFRIILISCTVLLIAMLHGCMTFRMTKKEIDNYFTTHHINGSQHTYSIERRNIHYIKAGDEKKPLILFVHGSPGSLNAFIHFFADSALANEALLIAVDRPGFGQSNFGVAETSLQGQARMLKPLLEMHRNSRPIILVGHSLGGPVIARIAIDFPELVDGLILVAPSIDPDLEPDEMWFRAPLATPFLRWILPASMRASNDEIYHLKPDLIHMLPEWQKITCPVVVVQGLKDKFVPAANASFAKDRITNATVTLMMNEEEGHFIPWTAPEMIKEAVLSLLSTHSLSSSGTLNER